MPPKPVRRRYREPVTPAGELHPVIGEFLLTGTHPPADAPDEVRFIAFEPDRAERHWRKHRRELIAEAKRRGFGPFALGLFGGATLPRLPQWRMHRPNPLSFLGDHPKVRACPHCGSRDLGPSSCLSKAAQSSMEVRRGH
jgi:hypothetical protein